MKSYLITTHTSISISNNWADCDLSSQLFGIRPLADGTSLGLNDGMWKLTLLLIVLVVASWACSKNTNANSSAPGAVTAGSAVNQNGEVKFKVPDGWVAEKTTSNMRVAQYKLPKAAGDLEDASLILYYFGQGQGGSTQANIDRWINQMQQPDGKPSKDKAKSDTMTVNGLKVTTVDVSGTYTAEMTPGTGGAMTNNANYRLRAAVIETPKGSYFAKLIGPEKTVAQWDQAFMNYVKSFEFK